MQQSVENFQTPQLFVAKVKRVGRPSVKKDAVSTERNYTTDANTDTEGSTQNKRQKRKNTKQASPGEDARLLSRIDKLTRLLTEKDQQIDTLKNRIVEVGRAGNNKFEFICKKNRSN